MMKWLACRHFWFQDVNNNAGIKLLRKITFFLGLPIFKGHHILF